MKFVTLTEKDVSEWISILNSKSMDIRYMYIVSEYQYQYQCPLYIQPDFYITNLVKWCPDNWSSTVRVLSGCINIYNIYLQLTFLCLTKLINMTCQSGDSYLPTLPILEGDKSFPWEFQKVGKYGDFTVYPL